MVTEEDLRGWIEAGLKCSHLEVHGPDGVHFAALVVSAEFEDKSQIQRHQLVYRCLGAKMGNEIHALNLKTLTPDEWKQ
ncbi:MAG: BolA/IbaG family iron-sulfur metabolism protein [Betaproteobacteria bacterium AqS2]|uniref:BolA/IbaG family iron-sulfur metabolism protein n=1 Tax=Candidatus Amphirhobacter heronislandensis TaxID=1732024 RepID=A0A930UHB9_9GAMM|nr:BolA/IbaG family iron-sulfur metabolism protein [Betaproteobacteria bacterium AqS2]